MLANTPPTLTPIAAQCLPANPPPDTVLLIATNPDLGRCGQAPQKLTYTAGAQTLPYWLKQTYGLFLDPGGYNTNARGQQEKYLRGTSSDSGYRDPNGYWYYLLSNGNLYEQAPP